VTTSGQPAPRWWDAHEIEQGHTLRCAVGPLTVWLYRGEDEWRLAWERAEESDDVLRVEVETRLGLPRTARHERYVFQRSSQAARLRPLLADRAVVVGAYQPVFVPSGEETTLYISSPLSLQVEVGEAGVVLQEIPILRLSDTWFGPNTREGELCYAARTNARHSLREVQLRPHRAVTPVRIRNQGRTQLPIEKLSLPVPLLSLYGRADGSLWTQAIALTRAAESDLANLRVDAGPPPEAAGASLLSSPRRATERGTLVRAFSGLFGS
jgi:hypothetical protein